MVRASMNSIESNEDFGYPQRRLDRCDVQKNFQVKIQAIVEDIEKNNMEEFLQYSQPCWNLFYVMCTFFFPEAIRDHVHPYVKFIGGLLIFIGLVAFFIWLYIGFGNCSVYTLETSERPDNAIQCVDKFLAQQSTLGLDIHGQWSTQKNYNIQFSGPWQIQFKGYQSNESVFQTNIQQLVQNARTFSSNLTDLTFIEILGQMLFYQQKVDGTRGSMRLYPDIDLEVVFDNYIVSGFTLIYLKNQLMANSGRVGYDVYLPGIRDIEKCQGKLQLQYIYPHLSQFFDNGESDLVSQYGDNNYDITDLQWECKIPNLFPENLITRQSTLIKVAPITYNIIFEDTEFFSDMQWYYSTLQNLTDINVYRRALEAFALPDKGFKLEFNLVEVFVYDYCNNIGKDFCREFIGMDDEHKIRYQNLAEFWGKISMQISYFGNQFYSRGITKRGYYIAQHERFVIHAGQFPVFVNYQIQENDQIEKQGELEYIFSNATGQTIQRYNNVTYTLYDLVVVPEIISYDPELIQLDPEQTEYINICTSCKKSLVKPQVCMRNLYVLLHLYVEYPSLYQNATLKDQINENYVTTFLYVLRSPNNFGWKQFWNLLSDQLTPLSEHFFYNKEFAEVNHLHCNTTEWTFLADNIDINDSDDNFSDIYVENSTNNVLYMQMPFSLTTGVQSCKVRECNGILQKLGDSFANVQLIYLVIVVLAIVVYLCFLLPYMRAKELQRRQEVLTKLTEAFYGLLEGIWS
eukprot:TRINITY_DN4043_c1_g1_i10.p2 TRINITY_DN4043_c1_g1~~TRINITY_DN4043_c1_g1_i10.p2  ORF type:complete len:743 (-),score=34.17 TRINITY_DN4043_c1_g1_i10:1573-3801(-)